MSRCYPLGNTTPFSDYERGKAIGHGTYGCTYKGVHIESKRFPLNHLLSLFVSNLTDTIV
jgi:hypothetical protein